MQFETLATGYGLLEGPRIDERNRLYYSDARGGGVFRRSPDGSIETLIAGRKMVGGTALNDGGGLIVTGATVSQWDEKTGRLTEIFAQWEGKPLFGMNDLTIDDQGSLWVVLVPSRTWVSGSVRGSAIIDSTVGRRPRKPVLITYSSGWRSAFPRFPENRQNNLGRAA